MPQDLVLRFPPDEAPESLSEGQLRFAAARELDAAPAELGAVRIRRSSFDARARHMEWRAKVSVWRRDEEQPAAPDWSPPRIPPPPAGAPVALVVGSGPAGLFGALSFLRRGWRVTVLERGKDVQARRRDLARLNRGEEADPDSNYCHGEGGAGTYSDGKLYARSVPKDLARAILADLVRHGAPESILTSWRPHIGSNRLPKVVEALRETILRAGGAVRFGARVDALLADAGRCAGVRLADGSELRGEAVLLATGHSAPDGLRMAQAAGARLEPKGFAMGVRVEHPQDWLDRLQYRGAREDCELPPAFYELSTRAQERGVYSFCMCPGGWVVPCNTTPHHLVVNGMSLSRRDSPYANSGVVVELQPEDWCGRRGARFGWPELLRRAAKRSGDPLLHAVPEPEDGPPIDVAAGRLPSDPAQDPWFGARIQLALEVVAAEAGGGHQRAPAQRCDDFLAARGAQKEPLPTSYQPGLTAADFDSILPRGLATRLRTALRAFDRKLPGYAGDNGQLIGVETRTSSPVRIARDRATCEAQGLPGLYPAGEGAGYAGGIVSAAADGMRCADSAIGLRVGGQGTPRAKHR